MSQIDPKQFWASLDEIGEPEVRRRLAQSTYGSKGVLWWMSGYAIDWPLMVGRMHDKKKNDAMLNWKLSVNHSE